MSNQSVDGFQGSQPFITDKQFQNLSLDEIRYIIEQEKEELKKDYSELEQRKRLIKQYKKLVEARNKVKQGIDIRKKIKKRVSKNKKIKTFEEYFEECIKNKKIPKDTPNYLRKALERAMYEHEQGIKIEKSALNEFAVKHVFEGIPGISPVEYLSRVHATLEEFFTNHRNIKFKMVLICLMETISVKTDRGVEEVEQSKSYFSSKTYRNLVSTNPEKLVKKCFSKILTDIEEYNSNGSGWYFKEVLKLEVNTFEFNPTKGSSYISLPDWISNKKQLLIFKIRMKNVFFGVYLDIFILKKEMSKDLQI